MLLSRVQSKTLRKYSSTEYAREQFVFSEKAVVAAVSHKLHRSTQL